MGNCWTKTKDFFSGCMGNKKTEDPKVIRKLQSRKTVVMKAPANGQCPHDLEVEVHENCQKK
jgi:hypothetical protein